MINSGRTAMDNHDVRAMADNQSPKRGLGEFAAAPESIASDDDAHAGILSQYMDVCPHCLRASARQSAVSSEKPLHDRLNRSRRVALKPIVHEQKRGFLLGQRLINDLFHSLPGTFVRLLDLAVWLKVLYGMLVAAPVRSKARTTVKSAVKPRATAA